MPGWPDPRGVRRGREPGRAGEPRLCPTLSIVSRIALIGAGHLGVFLASHLLGAGHEVFLCVRRAPQPFGGKAAPALQLPFFLHDPPPADIILLTVKVYDTPSAVRWLPALGGDRQPTAVIQNGVHHAARIAPFPALPVLAHVYIETQGGVYRAFAPPRCP
jgi:Ketopantoate reductase PanE/ApbA